MRSLNWLLSGSLLFLAMNSGVAAEGKPLADLAERRRCWANDPVCATPEWQEETIRLMKGVLDSGGRDFESFLTKFDYGWFAQMGPKFEPFAIRVYRLFTAYGLSGDLYLRDDHGAIENSALLSAFNHRYLAFAETLFRNGADPNAVVRPDYRDSDPDFTVIGPALADPKAFALLRTWNVEKRTYLSELTSNPLSSEALRNLSDLGLDLLETDANGFNQLHRLLVASYYRSSFAVDSKALDFILKNSAAPLNRLVPTYLGDGSPSGYDTSYLQAFFNTFDRHFADGDPHTADMFSALERLKAEGQRFDWNLKDRLGRNVLYDVVRSSQPTELFDRLVGFGADPQIEFGPNGPAESLMGWNLYFVAYNPAIIPRIKANGVDIDHRDSDGNTALITRAIDCGGWGNQLVWKLAIAKALVANGADPSLKNRAGKTALELVSCEEMKSFLAALPAKHRD